MGGSRVKNGGGLLVGGVGVGHGDGTLFRCAAGKFHRAGKLRRHIRDAQQPLRRVIQAGEGIVVRQAEIRRVLRALFLFGEERPLHLDAQQAGAALRRDAVQPHRRAERRFQHVVGQRHRRGGEGCDAVFCQIGGHFYKAAVVPVGEIRAGVAVGMDIHQPGDDPRAAKVHALPVRRVRQHVSEPAVLHGEAAGDKTAAHKNQTVFKPHITPPADWLPPQTGPRGGTARPAGSRKRAAPDTPPPARGGTRIR